jgi:hypothetical protein
VKNIRELVDSYKKKDWELMAEYDEKNKPEIRIDERKAMKEQWLKESDAVHDSACAPTKKIIGQTPYCLEMNYTGLPKRSIRQIYRRYIKILPTFSVYRLSPITWN